MHTVRKTLGIIFIYLIGNQCFASNNSDAVLGEYYTYCECGSNITLVIKENGSAFLDIKSEGELTHQKAKWQIKDNLVTISYQDIEDVFVFDKKIPTINTNLSHIYGYTQGLELVQTNDLKKSLIMIYGGGALLSKKGDEAALVKKLKKEAISGVKNIDISMIDAIEQCDVKSVEENITKGADINFTDNNGTTPLMYAVQTDYPAKKQKDCSMKIVKLLIKKGADVNAQDNQNGKIGGNHVINIAAFYSSIDMVKLLIDNGADINLKDSAGKNILFSFLGEYGSKNNEKFEFIKYMVQKGIDISGTTRFEKDSALMLLLRNYSDYSGLTDLAKLFIKNGVDLEQKNIYGETALSIAKKKKIDKLIFLVTMVSMH